MTTADYMKVQSQIIALEELLPIYSGKTLDNIIEQLKARLKESEKTYRDNYGKRKSV